MNGTPGAYADHVRQRRDPPQLRLPRNMKAAEEARELRTSLFVSFIGDTGWPNPTVYCDSGNRYDWGFTRASHVVVVAKPGADTLDALQAILACSEVIYRGYPVLLDVDQQEASCVIHGTHGPQLWQVRKESPIWQQYFATFG